MNEVLERIRTERAIAVIRVDSPQELIENAVALYEGGMRCLEFTMTTPGALEMLREAVKTLGPSVILGAGTVLDAETARASLLAGAQFLVSPAVRMDVIAVGKRYGAPVMPGALTPTEVLDAWEAGGDVIKVFPASRLGPAYLKDLHGPFPQIPLMPTGGITPETAPEFLKAGAVAVGIGGAFARRAAGETAADLTERARRLMQSL